MVRSVLAVSVGLCFILAFSFAADVAVPILVPGAFSGPEGGSAVGLLLLTVTYVAVATVLGGYLTAQVAGSHPARHALALGGLALVLVATGTALSWTSAPAWYHAFSLVFVLPFAWLGGYLHSRRLRTQ